MVGELDLSSPHRLLFRGSHREAAPGSASPLAASAAIILSARRATAGCWEGSSRSLDLFAHAAECCKESGAARMRSGQLLLEILESLCC